jgi:hypothetical protein
MSQSHVTLAFPLKWPADANALAEKLPPLMPELLVASDLMGTIHYCRWRSARGRYSTPSSSIWRTRANAGRKPSHGIR